MTQFVSFQLPNAATVNKDFAVGNINYQTGIATWNLVGSSFDANYVLSLAFKPASAASSRIKVRAKLVIPIMDPVLTTKKVDECIAEVTISVPKIATLSQRQDLRVLLRNFQLNDAFVKSVDNFEGVY